MHFGQLFENNYVVLHMSNITLPIVNNIKGKLGSIVILPVIDTSRPNEPKIPSFSTSLKSTDLYRIYKEI